MENVLHIYPSTFSIPNNSINLKFETKTIKTIINLTKQHYEKDVTMGDGRHPRLRRKRIHSMFV